MELTKDLTVFNQVSTPTGIEFFNLDKIQDRAINEISYLVIGTNGSSNVCVNKIDGSVWLADEETKFFVNSGLSQFTDCLTEHGKIFSGKEMSDEETYQSALKLRKTIQTVDPKAMAEDTFWYWITEENIEIYEAWNDED